MKWFVALFALFPLAATVAATPSHGRSAGIAPPSTSLLPARIVKSIQAHVKAGDYPAMVVAVAEGKRSHIYTFGQLANGKAPDADTIFQIGSVTKTFTATLLALALDQGEVQLDTPVEQLLPGWKLPSRDGKPITLGELATQYSGLPRLPDNFHPANPHDPYADYDAARLKAFLAAYKLPRDPGTKFEYSNLGYGLLGYALAQRAGTTYGKLVKARILAPLGMTSTSTTVTMPLGPRWAKGHGADGKPAQPWHIDALAGAGAINSTGTDMLRYLEANMGRSHGALMQAMRLAHKPRRASARGMHVGLAWQTRQGKDAAVVWHNGATAGYTSFLGFTTDGSRGVVILTNVYAPGMVDALGFATLLPGMRLTPVHKQIHLSAAQLEDYVGQYQLAPKFILKVFHQGDQLFAQATGQGAFRICPEAADTFFAKIADIELDFQRDRHGKVEALVLHQNGADHRAPRIP